MNFNKHIFLGVLVLCIAAIAGAQTPLTIYAIKGPSGVGMIRLFEDPPVVSGVKARMEALAQADLVAAKFIAGEAKVGILPPNVAAKIASTEESIQIAAVTGTGMLSLITGDPAVQRIEDLKGKQVETAGQGATPDYVFRRILLSKGINPDRDIQLSYSLAYPEIAQSLIAGRISNALLPEPFATMALSGKSSLRVIGDVQAEWVAAGGSGNYPMTVLVVDANFARSDPAAMQTILSALKASVEWVTAHPAEAGALVEKHDLGLRAPVVTAAVPRSNYVYISAKDAKPSIEALFKVFLEFAPASIGEKLPSDSFYFGL
jgi:NitT/TauT family transport system substrate-binding protein